MKTEQDSPLPIGAVDILDTRQEAQQSSAALRSEATAYVGGLLEPASDFSHGKHQPVICHGQLANLIHCHARVQQHQGQHDFLPVWLLTRNLASQAIAEVRDSLGPC